MNTDPIADLLIRIKNAYLAKRLEVVIPYSKVKEGVVAVLVKYEFVDAYEVEGEGKNKMITVQLRYDETGKMAIENIKRVSKPGLRRYTNSKHIEKIRNGFGISIITTNKGIMAGHEAQAQNLGGEVLAQVW
jgi:small subunit ribosomal protein S8